MRGVFIPSRNDSEPKPTPLERLAAARVREAATHVSVEDQAKTMPNRDEVLTLHTRATAPLGTTGTSGFASQLVEEAFGDFLASLAPGSAAARIIADGLRLPMGRAGTLRAVKRNAAATVLPWVGEGDPIPVREYDFAGVTLTPKKLASLSVISGELSRRSGATAVIRQLLREDAELSLDSAYFSAAAADSATHAGLLDGITATTGFGGGDKEAFEQDVLAILSVIAPGGSGRIAFVTGLLAAEKISLKFPDFKSSVYGSAAVSDTTLIGVDAGSLVHSFGDFEVDASTNALVHMSDDPDPIVASGTADPVRSLFQTDAVGLRILGDIAFGARKANAVHYVTGVAW